MVIYTTNFTNCTKIMNSSIFQTLKTFGLLPDLLTQSGLRDAQHYYLLPDLLTQSGLRDAQHYYLLINY